MQEAIYILLTLFFYLLTTYVTFSLVLFAVRKIFKLPKFKDVYKPVLISAVLSAVFLFFILKLPQFDPYWVAIIPILVLLTWLKRGGFKLSLKNIVSVFLLYGLSMTVVVFSTYILNWVYLAITSSIFGITNV